MFVRYFVELPLAFEDVNASLLDHPEEWIPSAARHAVAHAHALLSQLGIEPGATAEEWVAVELGHTVHFPSRTVLSMSWRLPGGPAPFGAVEADIDAAGMGPELTHLAVAMQYTPPFSAARCSTDRSTLARVAEAMLKDFVDGIAAQITAGGAAETRARTSGR